MDILIKNMEMPKCCYETDGQVVKPCDFLEVCRRKWGVNINALDIHSEACPLVALPEHGRLVSAEDFIDSFEDIINECRRQLSEKGEDITILNYFHDTIVELMGYMPTVLEATK